MTASTTTTATPPRLDDRSFSIRDTEDEFGNMFANLTTKSSREVSSIKAFAITRYRGHALRAENPTNKPS